VPKGLDNGPRPKNCEKESAVWVGFKRRDARQPGDGVKEGGVAEGNQVAEYLVTGLAPLPTKAGDRADTTSVRWFRLRPRPWCLRI